MFSFRESRSLRADSSPAGLRSCVPPSLPKQKRFPKEETVKFLEAERQACVSVSQRRPLLAGRCVHFQQAQTQGHAQEETRTRKLWQSDLAAGAQSRAARGAHTVTPQLFFGAAFSPRRREVEFRCPGDRGTRAGGWGGPCGQTPLREPWGGGEQVCAWRSHVVLLPRGRKMGSFDLNRVFLLLRAFSTPGPSSHRRV